MCSTNVNEAKLFARTVPVSITDAFSTNFRSLFLSIEWKQTSTVIMKKELLITLTDSNDPFFLFNLQLSEDDYQRLKSSQNLRVDFSAFPQIVIDFLKRCLNETDKPQPNYLLHLTMGEAMGSIASSAQLDIEKSFELRQVSLLSLKFLAATESTVKQHMTDCFKSVKTENQNLQQRLCYLEKDFKERLTACESALEKKTQELESVKRELSDEIKKKESTYTHILMEEREQFLKKQREGENRLESERIGNETKLKNEISQLESKLLSLEAINKELENKKTRLEKQVTDLRSDFLSVDNELRQKNGALSAAERRNLDLDSELKERNSRINHLMKNISKLNEDIKSKQEQVENQKKDVEDFKKEKKRIAKDLEEARNRMKEIEKLKEKAESDVAKADQIIAKMQHSSRDDYNQIQILEKKISKLEDKLKEKEVAVQYLKKDLKKERDVNNRLTIEIQHLPVYQAQIADLEKVKKENEMVIDQLTKAMSIHGIIPQYIPPPHLTEIRSASGDAINEGNTFPPTTSSKSKQMPSSNSIENAEHPETRQTRRSLPGNCAYPPVCTANGLHPDIRQMRMGAFENSAKTPLQDLYSKASTIIASDKNAEQSNLEINSNGLSTEFKGLTVSKHSTARKQTKVKSSHIPVKS